MRREEQRNAEIEKRQERCDGNRKRQGAPKTRRVPGRQQTQDPRDFATVVGGRRTVRKAYGTLLTHP
eukprot:1746785-Prymnesium_polylepis.1